ncbi:beta propeller repeat protein [Pragia fontium]|uniref:Uncharacterized protein n=2 Tax=Pragia fontium TaxID=82985 RepID=A0AAJ5BG80_9GAMM|nr:hypothetical protein [Pragia fontium]GKX63163.1 hypothetical protein SOASR032_17320 [Pragia fontium]SFC31544.1 hypothetical protein SAMN02745723_10246 [Pragia fontium DSM 5563 = ATCC 49100]VEJ54422.1 Uncharacterised protein [Pragia fontium]
MIIDQNIKFTGGCLVDNDRLVLTSVDNDIEFYSDYSEFSFWDTSNINDLTFTTLEVKNWADNMVRYISAQEEFNGLCCLSPVGKVFFIQDGKIVSIETLNEVERWGNLRNIVQIGGQLYVCGNKGQIYQRVEKNKWQHIDDSILSEQDRKAGVKERKKMRDEVINSLPEEQRTMENITRVLDERKKQEKKQGNRNLSAINGYCSNDIYVCGTSPGSKEGGVVFHYNGINWQRLTVPTTDGLLSIYLHDENTVYIGGYNGYLLKGNYRDGFIEISDSTNLVSIDNFVSIAGRVFLSTNKGVRQLKDDKVVTVDMYDELNQVASELLNDTVIIDVYGDNLLIVGKKVVCRYSFKESKINFLLSVIGQDDN